MATAITLITRAMRLAGITGVGETPSDTESADGLTALNAMLDSWIDERLFVSYIVDSQLTLVPSQASYTMGSGGDLNVTRPVQLEDSCFIRYLNIDTPLQLIDQQAYAAIISKTIGNNIPMYLFADYQYPLINLYFYPVPTSASAIAHVKSWSQLQSFASLTTALSLPPGNERAIVYSLAEEFGPEFGVKIPAEVKAIAMKARANIKRVNAPSTIMRTEVGYLTRFQPPFNIWTG